MYVEKRQWLNPVGHWNSGAVSCSVSRDSYSVNVDLSIWDCNKKISLDLSFSDKKEALQVAKKIEVLQETLASIKKGMGAAYDDLRGDKDYEGDL